MWDLSLSFQKRSWGIFVFVSPKKGGMVSLFVSPNKKKRGIIVNNNKEDMASLFVSPSKGGVASLSVPKKKAWPLC